MNLKALKELRKRGLPEGEEKITIVAPNKEGLEEGLSKAKEIVKEGPESLLKGIEESHEMEDEHEHEEEEKDLSDEALEMMSLEELKECIRKLRDE